MIRRLAITLLATAVLVLPLAAAAADPKDLIASGDLTVSTALSPDSNIVPGQQVRLLIEVATHLLYY